MPRVTANEVLAALQRAGWYVSRQGKSSHVILRHGTRPGVVPVPMHAGNVVKAGTLNSMLKQAGLTVEEFRRLL